MQKRAYKLAKFCKVAKLQMRDKLFVGPKVRALRERQNLTLDACAKWLVLSLPVLQVVWLRFVFHVLIASALLAPRYGLELVRVHDWKLQALRAVMMAGMTALNFWALQYLQLAETGAIQFSVPLLIAPPIKPAGQGMYQHDQQREEDGDDHGGEQWFREGFPIGHASVRDHRQGHDDRGGDQQTKPLEKTLRSFPESSVGVLGLFVHVCIKL
jgi:hypothetical protein